jgi:hypothetical protein
MKNGEFLKLIFGVIVWRYPPRTHRLFASGLIDGRLGC